MATLDRELATYAREWPEMQQSFGKFVLIKDDSIEGVFDTYADALQVGYDRFQLQHFLVKQVTVGEQVNQFTRDLTFACR